MRIRSVFLATSFVLVYFLGLTYAVLRVGTYAGLEEYSLLVLAAVVFGILTMRDKTTLGTAILVFFNASRMFALGSVTTFLLNELAIIRIPLDNTNFFGVWIFPFGLYVILNFVYLLGFKDRKQRYFVFAWAGNAPQVSGTRLNPNSSP